MKRIKRYVWVTGDAATVTTRITAGRRTMIRLLKNILEFTMYIVEFVILVAIAWGISLIFPIKCFEAGILLMVFWFLCLYNSNK